MAINLVRNSKVYLTTNVDSVTGAFTDNTASATSASLYELQVLDGYSFNQNTETQQITVNEAGTSPVRGSRTFNTALAPVEWSITTYVRPTRSGGRVLAAERVLWNALNGSAAIDTTGVAVTSIARANFTSTIATATVATHSFVAGDAVNFQITGNTANSEWSQPARVISTSATTLIVETLKPAAASGGTSTGTLTGALVYGGSWAQSASASGNYSYTSTMGSQKNQLQKFAMLFVVDNTTYCVENCSISQASIDFGLDQIAQIAWTGQGTTLKQLTAVVGTVLAASATTAIATAGYITNKLSTMTLQSKIGGSDNTASTSYVVAITGGNLTIANNNTYLTPANLGVVNNPITYFTGTRSITGNVTAYLKTGSDSPNGTGDLLNALLRSSASETEPKFKAVLQVGATSGQTAVPRMDLEMNGAMLQIPTVEIQDVVSTTINFVAQPYNPDYINGANNAFDLERSNELFVKYYSN